MNFTCTCGANLSADAESDGASFEIDCIHYDFVCEDETCGKQYSVEFTPIDITEVN